MKERERETSSVLKGKSLRKINLNRVFIASALPLSIVVFIAAMVIRNLFLTCSFFSLFFSFFDAVITS